MKLFQKIMCNIAGFIYIIAFGFILYGSLRYTTDFYMPDSDDYPGIMIPKYLDGIKPNLIFAFFLFLCLLLVCLLIRKLPWLKWPVIILCGVGATVFSFCYVTTTGSEAWADPQAVMAAAKNLISGNYEYVFGPESYIAKYPHQMGLLLLFEILQRLIFDYSIPTDLNTLMMTLNSIFVGIIVIECGLSSYAVWHRDDVAVITTIMAAAFLPLHFVAVFPYGELISIVFMFASIIAFINLFHSDRFLVGNLVLLFISGFMAVMFRKNTLIVFVAFGIVAIVKILSGASEETSKYITGKKQVLTIGLAVFVILLSGVLPNMFLKNVVYREKYISYDAMPSILWLNIGLGSGNGAGYGAYDGRAGEIWELSGYNAEIASEIAMADIQNRIDELKEYHLVGTFFKEKLWWQWIEPTYQVFTYANYPKDGYPVGLAYRVMHGDMREIFFSFMNKYQSFIYLVGIIGTGMLLLNRRSIDEYIFTIMALGGFFFSAIWEAKPRYVYVYALFCIIVGAYGINALFDRAVGEIKKRLKG